MKDAYYIVQLL